MKIGVFPETSLKDARARHLEARALLDKGIDPIEETRRQHLAKANALDVEGLCNKWMTAYAKRQRKRPEIPKQMIAADIAPRIGRIMLHELDRRQISQKLLDPIVERGSLVQANKTLKLLKQILSYGVDHGYIDTNPALPISARNVGGTEKPRERHLTEQEIRVVWSTLKHTGISQYVQIAIKLLLVTGQRRGELTLATWDEIDFTEKVWTLPPERTKNGKVHRVPLSELATALFRELGALSRGNEWIMPSNTGEPRPMNERVITKAVRRYQAEFGIPNWVPHDLRRTFSTHVNALTQAPHVVEKLLNHTMEGVMATYNRHDYWDEKVAAMDAWSGKLGEILGDELY
jgi:integrase